MAKTITKPIGRKSEYGELADADALIAMFFQQVDAKKLVKKIQKTGKYSIAERMVLDALRGNTRAQVAVFNRVFPEEIRLNHTGGIIHGMLPAADVKKIISNLNKKIN